MGAVSFTRATGPSVHPTGYSFYPVLDNKRVVKGTLNFSSSYATGGDSIDLAQVGLSELQGMLIEATSQGGLSIVLAGTSKVPLIRAFDANGTEVTAATNLSTRASYSVWLVGV